MKGIHRLGGIVQCICALPRTVRFVVAHPIHEVLKVAAPDPQIHDSLHLELRDSIHFDRRWDVHDTSRESVGDMWFQETHMEKRINFYGRGESQAISQGSNLANDREGSKSADVQFG